MAVSAAYRIHQTRQGFVTKLQTMSSQGFQQKIMWEVVMGNRNQQEWQAASPRLSFKLSVTSVSGICFNRLRRAGSNSYANVYKPHTRLHTEDPKL